MARFFWQNLHKSISTVDTDLSAFHELEKSRFKGASKILALLYGHGKCRAPQFAQLIFHFSGGNQRCARVVPHSNYGGLHMLRWALIFFVVALVAAVLGFTGIAMAAAGVAKILFYIFVVLFVLSLLGHVARRP